MSLSLALPHGGPRLVANARVDAAPTGAELETDGSRLINASTDDALALSGDTRVKEAAMTGVKRFGLDLPRASTVTAQLEGRLAARFRTDAAALADSIATVLRPIEQTEARCLVDARLFRRLAPTGTPFGSVDQLAALLETPLTEHQVIVVDGVHAWEGDLAPLPRLFEVAQRHHVPVVVIDALGPGALGALGAGVLEHFELAGQADLFISTLGPGCVALAGIRAVVDAFTPFLPARLSSATISGVAKRLELLDAEPHRRKRALDLAEELQGALRLRGFDPGPSVTPIVPVWLGDEGLTEGWLRQLSELGIFCRGLLDGPRSRLLLSLPATLADPQLQQVIDALEKVEKKIGTPPGLEPDAPRTATVARPGTFAIASPCHPRWLPVSDAPVRAMIDDGRSVKERVLDTVETLTWRIASGQSGQLRRLPGAETLRALVDRARRR